LSVRYGGVLAADEVSLVAEAGKITGLIGPNGAGKTTVFNACSGLVRPRSGTVQLDQRSLDRVGPPARARRGLGRTFQQMELFDSLSARENVALGCEGGYAGWNPVNHLITRRSQREEVLRRTAWAIELCAISGFAEEPVGTLSTGQRRLVELARCAAGRFRVLLLDEPSSGLDRIETERFGEILTRVVAERRVGILLIEHDMALVNRICDYIYVIDFGKAIFQGTVGEVGASAVVRAAYLGDEGSAPLREVEADVVQE
jgi:ABC-type branched-subunit amino acid transport system ATPase component